MLQFDFDVDSAGQIQFCKTVDGLGIGTVNVNQTFVSAKFELFTSVLVLVRSTQHRHYFLFGGKRNGTGHFTAHFLAASTILLQASIHKVDGRRL